MIVFLVFLSTLAHASGLNPKWDFEVREISRNFSMKGLPDRNIDAWWAAPDYNRKSGLLAKGVKGEYRHMHGMVAAAFYAKRKDHREAALAWLQRYDCENWVACNDTFQFYDAALKANTLTLPKHDRSAAEKLRDKLAQDLKTKESQKLKQEGLCTPISARARWLAEEYRLFCPRGKMVKPGGLSEGGADLKAFEHKLTMDSGQALLSSSFLEKLEHQGKEDCSEPWQTKLTCNGKVKEEFLLHCERTATGEVRCRK